MGVSVLLFQFVIRLKFTFSYLFDKSDFQQYVTVITARSIGLVHLRMQLQWKTQNRFSQSVHIGCQLNKLVFTYAGTYSDMYTTGLTVRSPSSIYSP